MATTTVSAASFHQLYPRQAIEQYWDRLEKTLGSVFSLPPEQAAGIVRRYRGEVEASPIGEQMLTYRESVLQTAASLAGCAIMNDRHVADYERLLGPDPIDSDEDATDPAAALEPASHMSPPQTPEMKHLDFDKLRQARLETDPFEYVIVPGFLGPDSVRRINATYPPINAGGSFPVESLDAGMTIKEVIDELDGPAFEAAIAEKFGVELSGRPKMYSLRGYTRAKDGQIHTDSKDKIITVLVYLNENWQQPGGRLRLLRDGRNVDHYAAEVAPDNGTLLVFKRSDRSWHGHHPFEGPRRSLQMNWMTSEGSKGWHKVRHSISATLKKMTAAA